MALPKACSNVGPDQASPSLYQEVIALLTTGVGFELLLLDVVRKCCDTEWLTAEWVSLHAA